jgi:hypothetical protein
MLNDVMFWILKFSTEEQRSLKVILTRCVAMFPLGLESVAYKRRGMRENDLRLWHKSAFAARDLHSDDA